MQQYAQAAKGLIANIAQDLKDLNLRLPEVMTHQLQPVQQGADPLAGAQAPSNHQQQKSVTPAQRAAASAAIEERVSRFKSELLASRIDLGRLRSLAFSGIPDKDGLRAITWKLLLGYLPTDPSGWDELLARKRTQYLLFCEELIINPKKKAAEVEAGGGNPLNVPLARPPPGSGGGATKHGGSSGISGGGSGTDSGTGGCSEDGDAPIRYSGGGSVSSSLGPGTAAAAEAEADPLSRLAGRPSSSSPSTPTPLRERLSGEQQQQLQRQREHERRELQRKLHGQDASDHPLALHTTSVWNTYFQDSEVMEQIDRDVMRTHPDMHFFSGDTEEADLHRREMKRALFLFAKLNPGLRYIQGMNELLAPLYYMFKTDTDRTSSQCAEADAFYCFVELLGEFRDHFCQQLDNSTSGIRATITRLMVLLRAVDPQVAEHLEKNKVNPQFFAFRWITLLLTQEFPFPDAVRIWDTLLSDPRGRMDCLLRVCLALLMHVRAQLLAGDFAANVKLLQRYPAVDVTQVLRAAAELPTCDEVMADLGRIPGPL